MRKSSRKLPISCQATNDPVNNSTGGSARALLGQASSRLLLLALASVARLKVAGSGQDLRVPRKAASVAGRQLLHAGEERNVVARAGVDRGARQHKPAEALAPRPRGCTPGRLARCPPQPGPTSSKPSRPTRPTRPTTTRRPTERERPARTPRRDRQHAAAGQRPGVSSGTRKTKTLPRGCRTGGPAGAGMNPSRIAARTFAPRSRWLAPRSAHQMMAGAAPGTSTRPTALDLEGHRAQPPDTPPEGSAPLRTGTQTQGPRNRDTMVEPSQGSACLAEWERSFRCRTRRHTGLNPRRGDR